jgi:glycosyltransferase involved in cell wall biosynthesis
MTSILIISGQFWPEGGGGALATYLIAKLLSACDDFKITIVTGTNKPAKIGNINFIIDEGFRIRYKPLRWFYFLHPLVWKYYKNLVKRHDVIYIPYGYELIPVAKELDKKVIVHVHDYQPVTYSTVILNDLQYGFKAELVFGLLEYGDYKPAIVGSLLAPTSMLYKSLISEVDIVICASQRQAEIIVNRARELAHKIRVIYNPLPETPPIEQKFMNITFTYAGGGSYIKGFHTFIRAAVNVVKQRNCASFLLAGEFRHEYKLLVRRLNDTYKGIFRLLGRLQHEEMLKLYSQSYAVLVPSICEEVFPYVVLESMLMGTLPVASRVGGIPEIVGGTYAERLTFTPGHSEEMADRMEIVLSLSQNQLADIGSTLRESVVKRFNNEVIKKQLLEVFSE